MGRVKHPNWQCPKCGQVLFWAGAASHMKRHSEGAKAERA